MSHYIVERQGKRYGTFVTRGEAQGWALENLDQHFAVAPITDRSEVGPPLKVGDVVRAKDERDRNGGMGFFVSGGSEGVVIVEGDQDGDVRVVFHQPAAKHGWMRQYCNPRDLIKVVRF